MQSSGSKTPSSLWLQDCLGCYCLGMIIEVWDASVGVELPESEHGRIQLLHARHHLALTHGMSQVAGELLLECLTASVGKDENISAQMTNANSSASRRVHHWGTPASLGMCLVQISSAIQPQSPAVAQLLPLQSEASLDNVQLEWSSQLASFITAAVR